jgi:hypothetical protein
MVSIAQDHEHDTLQDDSTPQGVAQPVEPGESAIGADVRDNTGEQGGEVIPQESHKMATYPTKINSTVRAWVNPFLAALREYPNVKAAAAAAGVDRGSVYDLLKRDSLFASLFNEARDVGVMLLEDVAMERVFEGIERPIYSKGQYVGSYREYPERLHDRLLQANIPRYRQASQGSAGGPTSVVINVTYNAPPNHLASAAQASGLIVDGGLGELATGSREGDTAE